MIWIDGKELEVSRFPNGEAHIKVKNLPLHINRVSFRYLNDQDLIELFLLGKHLKDQLKSMPELLIYYMPYSRMDRSVDGSIYSLKYIADFIAYIGFEHISIIEPHSEETGNHFSKWMHRHNQIDVTHKLLNLASREIDSSNNVEVLVYPDRGAYDRYSRTDTNYAYNLTADKVRDTVTGRITSLSIKSNYLFQKGFTAIIRDDLTSKGGTFLMCAKELKNLGATKIYLVVAHAEYSIFEGALLDGDIDKVFTTNTIIDMDAQDREDANGRLKVYDVEDLI